VVPQKTDRLIERYFVTQGKLQQELAILSAEKGIGLPRFITANALIRKASIEKAGYFDNDLITHEDTDLSWRLVLNGFEIGYAENAVVLHKHITTLFKFISHQFELGRAFYVIHKKYEGVLFVYLSSKWRFFFSYLFYLLNTPCLFFKLRRNYKEKSNSLALLAVINIYAVICGELLAFILDSLYLTPPIPGVLNLDINKVMHKHLLIGFNGAYFKPAPDIIWFLSAQQIKFMNIKDASFYKLNESSSHIWQLLCQTQDFSKTVKTVVQEYGIPEQAASHDVQELLRRLEEEKLILKNAR